MPLTIDTTRFGPLDIAGEAVIEFPAGLIGLGGSRYALLANDENAAIVWLQSIDDPSLALPVANPWQFFADYEVKLSDSEATRIGISDPSAADVYVTVRATQAVEDSTANLRAPIVVSAGRGWQVINEAENAPMRAPLFAHVPAPATPEPVA
ncbi:MAG TPA: flagellar assembly protein FliW [Thermoleophilaceae bacterium]|jgi:flagellar assembly factor FliW